MTDAPSWARGYPVDVLKEHAAVFRESMKAHTYGAFGLPKERDVADALAAGDLAWTRMSGNAIKGVAIARRLARPSTHEDFAGRRITLGAGHTFVKAIAGSPAAMVKMLESLRRASLGAIWVEGHVESQPLREALDEVGIGLVATKIAASSDLKGLFVRNLSPEPLQLPAALNPADAPGVKILAEEFLTKAERDQILAELEAYGEHWADHYSSYNKRHSWSAFALQGFDPDPAFIIKPAEMSKAWKEENPERLKAHAKPTSAHRYFPTTAEILGRLPSQSFERVRFMRLTAAGGELTRHADITDPDAGTADGKLVRLHIPLRTDPAILFRSWDLEGQEHRLHFRARGLCYIDTRKPHAVQNPSGVERIHLVVDAFSTPELRRLIA